MVTEHYECTKGGLCEDRGPSLAVYRMVGLAFPGEENPHLTMCFDVYELSNSYA